MDFTGVAMLTVKLTVLPTNWGELAVATCKRHFPAASPTRTSLVIRQIFGLKTFTLASAPEVDLNKSATNNFLPTVETDTD